MDLKFIKNFLLWLALFAVLLLNIVPPVVVVAGFGVLVLALFPPVNKLFPPVVVVLGWLVAGWFPVFVCSAGLLALLLKIPPPVVGVVTAKYYKKLLFPANKFPVGVVLLSYGLVVGCWVLVVFVFWLLLPKRLVVPEGGLLEGWLACWLLNKLGVWGWVEMLVWDWGLLKIPPVANGTSFF